MGRGWTYLEELMIDFQRLTLPTPRRAIQNDPYPPHHHQSTPLPSPLNKLSGKILTRLLSLSHLPSLPLLLPCELDDRLDPLPIQIVFRQEPSPRVMQFAQVVLEVFTLAHTIHQPRSPILWYRNHGPSRDLGVMGPPRRPAAAAPPYSLPSTARQHACSHSSVLLGSKMWMWEEAG